MRAGARQLLERAVVDIDLSRDPIERLPEDPAAGFRVRFQRDLQRPVRARFVPSCDDERDGGLVERDLVDRPPRHPAQLALLLSDAWVADPERRLTARAEPD